jgi:hypothetical protein
MSHDRYAAESTPEKESFPGAKICSEKSGSIIELLRKKSFVVKEAACSEIRSLVPEKK